MAIRSLDLIGRGFWTIVGGDEERADYRPTPASDGKKPYGDRGQLGGYRPSGRDDVNIRRFEGYGADAADLERGYNVPTIREDPAYDLANYRLRSSTLRDPGDDDGNTDAMADDMEFRRRNQQSRGFLTRPRFPTER
jgi:hypothetical protein